MTWLDAVFHSPWSWYALIAGCATWSWLNIRAQRLRASEERRKSFDVEVPANADG